MERLSDGRTWIMGENYTLADINMMPYIARLTYLGLIEVWIKDKPAIADWWQRAHLLPSFKKRYQRFDNCTGIYRYGKFWQRYFRALKETTC